MTTTHDAAGLGLLNFGDRLAHVVSLAARRVAADVRRQRALDGATVLTLRRGQGPVQEVARLQRALGLRDDGVFGPATEAAVMRYRLAHSLAADPPGTAGPETQAALGTSVVLGVDLSGWQGQVDFAELHASGVRWCILKASQRGTNKAFGRNVLGARAQGMPFGAYHFYVTSAGPAQNAAWFLEAVRGVGMVKGPLVLDLEDRERKDPVANLRDAREFLRRVADFTGRKPWIYSRPSYWNGHLAGSRNPSRWPADFWTLPDLADLWRIGYTGTSDPGPVSPWKEWRAWQWSADGRRLAGVDGVESKGLDVNWIAGGGLAAFGAE